MDEHFVSGLPGITDGTSQSIGNGNSMNGIGVRVVENEDVMITAAGRSMEFASLIRVGFEKVTFGEERGTELMGTRFEMRFDVGVGVTYRCSSAEQRKTSRTNVSCFLILMAKYSGK